MDEVFMEKIVQRRKTSKDYLKIVGLLMAFTIFLFVIVLLGNVAPFLMTFIPFLLFGGGYGVWYLMSSMNREFEYIVTNGDLDIDTIIARRKRKRLYSGKSKDFELMAKVGGDEYREAQKGSRKLLDCSSSIDSPNNWFILTEYKGQKLMVIFAPDDRMLKSLKRFNPSRIKYTIIGI
jgi:hypothetical protein